MRSRRADSQPDLSPLRPSSHEHVAAAHDQEPASTRVRRSAIPTPPRSREPLLTTPYSTLVWDDIHSMARFTRSSLPYATLKDIEVEGSEIEKALRKVGKARLLVDLRAATPRNDPSFEAAIMKFRRKLFGGGQQVGVLVRTAMGALQVKRHMREDGFGVEVFTEEPALIAYLRRQAVESGKRLIEDGPTSRPVTGALRRVG